MVSDERNGREENYDQKGPGMGEVGGNWLSELGTFQEHGWLNPTGRSVVFLEEFLADLDKSTKNLSKCQCHRHLEKKKKVC